MGQLENTFMRDIKCQFYEASFVNYRAYINFSN